MENILTSPPLTIGVESPLIEVSVTNRNVCRVLTLRLPPWSMTPKSFDIERFKPNGILLAKIYSFVPLLYDPVDREVAYFR